jgi:hypothetical protein
MLLLWAGVCVAFAFNTFRLEDTVVHEIEGEIALLIATVAIVGVGIIEAVKKSGKGEQKD